MEARLVGGSVDRHRHVLTTCVESGLGHGHHGLPVPGPDPRCGRLAAFEPPAGDMEPADLGGSGLGLVVEIKERRRVDEAIARLREVLEATQALEDIVLLSFDHPSLLLAKEGIPGIRTEIITHARHVDIVAVAQAARADSISVELDMLHADDASALAEAGVGIRCHLPQSAWLARHEAYGLDPTRELVTALRGGAITSISGDDVGSLREFLTARGLPAPPPAAHR